MSQPEIRAVTFDMDGLMFNTEDLYDIVGEQLLNRRGHRFTTELKREVMGLPGDKAFAVIIDRCELDDSIEALANECEVLFEDLLPKRIEKMPGLESVLQILEEHGIPKGVATSSHARFAKRSLGLFELLPRFDFILTSESVTNGKPHPEVYLKAAQNHGVEPSEMLVLEDSVHGSNAGLAAGAVTIAVPSKQVDRTQIGAVYATCDRLDDPMVLDLIRN